MVSRILEMMDLHKVSAKQLTTELELSNSAVSEWKKGKSKPSTEAVVKIAAYFGVTTDYILTGKKPDQAAPAAQELTENEKELLALLHRFDERTQLKFLGRVEAIADEMAASADRVPKSVNG